MCGMILCHDAGPQLQSGTWLGGYILMLYSVLIVLDDLAQFWANVSALSSLQAI